jgi:hypothetical protein
MKCETAYNLQHGGLCPNVGAIGAVVVLAVALAVGIATASASDEAGSCLSLIKNAEKSRAIPRGLLEAIAFTESSRMAVNGQRVPWPWTVNAQGQGYYFETKKDAIAFVEVLQAQGVNVIDVGCMQVDLYYHPSAFASLDAAFDPATNVSYAAQLLSELKSETGDWQVATQYYHSRTPDLGRAYAQRVIANGFGEVNSNIEFVKPLTAREKAILAEEVPDDLTTANELIARSRTIHQLTTATTAVERVIAAAESAGSPAAALTAQIKEATD